MTNSVTARACVDAACATVRPVGHARAANGAPAEDRHARRSGHRHVRLSLLDRRHRPLGRRRQPRVARRRSACRRRAAPRWCGPDGTFVIRATLRSLFTDDGDLTLAARGRYAVASVEGGNATVYGIAGQDTHVALAQPQLRAAAQDRRQAPALLDPHPRRRRPRARRDQDRQQDARDRLLHAAAARSRRPS